MAEFVISQVGPLVSVQDGGRKGMLRFGVPASGPMDRSAFAIANAVIGNPADAPAIEVSVGGLTLDCTDGAVAFAVVGGGFQVGLGEARFGSWMAATIRAGTRLTIRPGPWGSWTYLAFAGRLQTDRWLSSAATHGLSGLGGGVLRAGGSLVVDAAVAGETGVRSILCPVFSRPLHRVRVIVGPQERFFSAGVLAQFLTQPFALTDAYDRMGVRLSGPSLRPEARLDMPSEAIVRGSVQVAGDGVATVLLADHQTTGGYPKIATILSCDIDRFAQLRNRDILRFQSIDPSAAIADLRAKRRAFDRYLESITPYAGQ